MTVRGKSRIPGESRGPDDRIERSLRCRSVPCNWPRASVELLPYLLFRLICFPRFGVVLVPDAGGFRVFARFASTDC